MKSRMRLPAALAALVLGALLLAGCGPLHRSVVIQPTAGHSQSWHRGAAVSRGHYRVVRGDTLYAIAFHAGVDFRDLAQWNEIAAPYTIWPGQVLRLSPRPVTARARTSHARSPLPRTVPATGFTPAVVPPSSSSVPVAGEDSAPASVATTPITPVPRGAERSIGGVTWRWPADAALIKPFKSGDAIPGIELAGKAGDPVRAAADGVVVYSGNGLVGYGELVIIKHSDHFLSAYGHNRKRLVKEGQRVSAGQQIAEMGATGASRNELQFQIRRDGNPVDPLDYLPRR